MENNKKEIIDEKTIDKISEIITNSIWKELSVFEYFIKDPEKIMVETSIYPKGKYFLLGLTFDKVKEAISSEIKNGIRTTEIITFTENIISKAENEANEIIRKAEYQAQRLSLKNIISKIENIDENIYKLLNHLGAED